MDNILFGRERGNSVKEFSLSGKFMATFRRFFFNNWENTILLRDGALCAIMLRRTAIRHGLVTD